MFYWNQNVLQTEIVRNAHNQCHFVVQKQKKKNISHIDRKLNWKVLRIALKISKTKNSEKGKPF